MATKNDIPDFKTLFFEHEGILYWNIKQSKRTYIGMQAGTLRKDGRLQTTVYGKQYLNHRIIYFLHKDYFPEYIDHIDGNPLNNHISNLREATLAENQWNKKICSRNKSGVKGINWHKQNKKWYARITVNKKRIDLGLYDDITIAEMVVKAVRNYLHGDYGRDK